MRFTYLTSSPVSWEGLKVGDKVKMHRAKAYDAPEYRKWSDYTALFVKHWNKGDGIFTVEHIHIAGHGAQDTTVQVPVSLEYVDGRGDRRTEVCYDEEMYEIIERA